VVHFSLVVHAKVNRDLGTFGHRASGGALDRVSERWRAAKADRDVERLGVLGLFQHSAKEREKGEKKKS
jgi:hypothetical protein